ncbi:hypothetical protein [Lentzea sp. NPDC003310]|uniref:hypothetical protein n=1 Tax=Lentzea sp. NPDC003310 TaxID=3154447 RepID=UPI0033B0083F
MTAVAALVLGTSPTAFAQDDPTAPPPPPTQAQAPPDSVAGTLYGDRNRNGRQDPGEAVQGEVTLYGGPGPAKFRTTSDASGAFAFQGSTATATRTRRR